METDPKIRFDDTAVAFSYKSDKALKKAHFIFSLVNNPWLSSIATGLAKAGLALKLPVKGLIRTTVFEHFCGGETIDQSVNTIHTLSKYHVGAILDYSAEGAKNEEGFDNTTNEILKTLDKAKGNPAIPFTVFKSTGLVLMEVLERVQSNAPLSPEQQEAFQHFRDRVEKICARAFEYDVPVMIDAEDSWIQNPIDELAYEMMRKYNQKRPIVYNTFQMYRRDMLDNLRKAYHDAELHNYFLGVKMVRGAYMEKEAERAQKMNYPNPIHPNKQATDDSFNNGLAFCMNNKHRISLMCGSHNEYSNQYLAQLMEKHGLKNSDNHVWFAQLLGMSDNISFNLAKADYNVAKYVPYGPVELVMPYLIRRAEENTSVAGQSSRELTLIRKEIARRKKQ
ncbi:MAG: proline dehydrogenase [Bacteroidetes bacterium OLB12]|nr:MAG: proline dehydrogenase [Bacteroidetes bacterium OLB12]HNR72883.1 proline dehydrogenase family protein [Cyclobacteriaceae bacterium]HNU41116.1 proline dehydrogenase family protein [Cyclobacteriaceae bacterium]